MKFFNDEGYPSTKNSPDMEAASMAVEKICYDLISNHPDISKVELRLMSDYFRAGIDMVFMGELCIRK